MPLRLRRGGRHPIQPGSTLLDLRSTYAFARQFDGTGPLFWTVRKLFTNVVEKKFKEVLPDISCRLKNPMRSFTREGRPRPPKSALGAPVGTLPCPVDFLPGGLRKEGDEG